MEIFLQNLLVNIVNMSITASYVIVFVLAARLLLKKAPRIFSYGLWSVVLFRLICPFSFSSVFSLLQIAGKDSGKMQYIPLNIGSMAQPQVNTGMNSVDSVVNASLPAATPYNSVNPIQIILFVLTVIWAIGIAALLIYSILSYFKLKRRVCTALLLQDNVFECENISSPFVLGIFKAKIYLPTGLANNIRSYILKHEKTHIRRFDHLVKPIAFLVLCIHWFNPLVWLGFILMTRDMETSCDERVLKEMGMEVKKEYGTTLLSLAVKPGYVNAVPIAFGESNVRMRIKNVLNYRKPAFWMVVAAAVVVLAVGFMLMANPFADEPDLSFLNVKNAVAMTAQQKSLILRASTGGGVPVSGTEFGTWLNRNSGSWQSEDHSIQPVSMPAIILYINNADGYKISFYEGQQTLASITYKNKTRFYKIPAGQYEWVKSRYALSSYLIPGEVLAAVLDGKASGQQSVQDIPNSGDYRVLQIGEDKYFIYEIKGKYYVEQPYQSIMEISEALYKKAIPFAIEETSGMNASRERTLEPVTPGWLPDQSIGADMAMLDYASNDIVIFHGYFGLYVYDLNNMRIVRSLDLVPLKCNMTQGDNACEVSVGLDGNTVQMHPLSSKNMYIYTVSANTLREVPYKKMEKPFAGQFVPIEEAVKSVTSNYSYRAVKFGTEEYGVLHTSDWTLGTLSYSRGDMAYALFRVKEKT